MGLKSKFDLALRPTQPKLAHYPTFISIPNPNLPDIEKTRLSCWCWALSRICEGGNEEGLRLGSGEEWGAVKDVDEIQRLAKYIYVQKEN